MNVIELSLSNNLLNLFFANITIIEDERFLCIEFVQLKFSVITHIIQ